MKIKVIIVDDELYSIEGIRIRLQNDKDIEIIGEYDTGENAVAAIYELKPDLVFLDIQMPEVDGFEVIKRLNEEIIPVIIFVTAHNKYAIKAFECKALDYILKPLSDERFETALKRAKERIYERNLIALPRNIDSLITYVNNLKNLSSQLALQNDPGPGKFLSRFVIKTKNNFFFLNAGEVDWLEAAGDYVYLHSKGKKHLYKGTMAGLESSLNPQLFSRIHKSVIVNLDRIKELRPISHGEFSVYLIDGSKLKLSRNYKTQLQLVLNNMF